MYKGSRDGFTSKAAHQKCDNQGPFFAIIKSLEKKNIFGVYSDIQFSQNFGWNQGRCNSFIFKLNDKDEFQ